MNKWIYWILLFLITAGIFLSGMFSQFFVTDFHTCVEYVMAGERYDCYPLVNWYWISFAFGIMLVVGLIFLTKKGWKKK